LSHYWVSQKGKIYLEFTEAKDSEWQWHQLGHMHLAADIYPRQHPTTQFFFTGRMPFLPPNQQCQSTEGKGWDRRQEAKRGGTENNKGRSSRRMEKEQEEVKG